MSNETQSSPKANILIVDDELSIRESMCEFLDTVGFASFSAESGDEALAKLEEGNMDVVITDIILQGMNGLELTDRIKTQYDIDVIVMTGYSGEYSYEEAVRKGASDFVFKPVRFEELLLRLNRVLNERKLTQERVFMLEKLKKLSITDSLTKLFNRRYFYGQLKLEIDRTIRYDRPLSLLLMDIDHFKNYNDTLGHLEGDKILGRMGEVIKSCLRKMDSAYRYGGEEFTIILPETEGEEAATVGERIRAAVENEPMPSLGNGDHSYLTISMGVTEYQPHETITIFVQRADKAMYLSKKAGRNRVTCLFTSKL